MKGRLLLTPIIAGFALMAACTKDKATMNDTGANGNDSTAAPANTIMRSEEAHPGQHGAWKSIVIDGDTLNYEVINGENVMEGDIIIPGTATQPDTSGIVSYSTGRADRQSRWPNNTVFYDINPNLDKKWRVNNAIAHWEQKTPLRFVRRTTQPNFVYFTGGDGCSSSVGRVGGRQKIELADGCNVGSAIHEIGHAVGLFHEQSRLDRGEFITIHWNRIEEGREHNFQTWRAQGYDGFDRGASINLNSIMMYGPYSFSKGNLPTITKKDGSLYEYQREGLSERDINTIKFMYP